MCTSRFEYTVELWSENELCGELKTKTAIIFPINSSCLLNSTDICYTSQKQLENINYSNKWAHLSSNDSSTPGLYQQNKCYFYLIVIRNTIHGSLIENVICMMNLHHYQARGHKWHQTEKMPSNNMLHRYVMRSNHSWREQSQWVQTKKTKKSTITLEAAPSKTHAISCH